MHFYDSYGLAFGAALLSAIGALFTKRAFQGGLGAYYGILVGNWIFLLIISPTWFLLSPEVSIKQWWWLPIVTGVVLTAGVYTNYFALHRGDVSVATPLLGLKTFFVAAISALVLRDQIPIAWWIASLLCMGALALFAYKNPQHSSSNARDTILLSILSAFCFALIDILIQEYAQRFGFFHLMVLAQLVVCGFSTVLVLFLKPSRGTLNRETISWLAIGTLFIASGFMVLSGTIAYYKTATALNVIFSIRGLFSVILVWTIGPLLDNQERKAGSRVLMFRLVGAGLLLLAILLLSSEPAVV